MRTIIRPLAAALLAAGSAPALAQSLTYDVRQQVGEGSVTGTLTTDGTLGVLQATNITTFRLSLNGRGASATLTGGSGGNARVVVQGNDLSASAAAITFNYSGSAGSYVLFQSNLFSGQTYWCNSNGTTVCLPGATVAPEYYTDPSATRATGLAGLQTIATRTGTTPDPTPPPTATPDPAPSPSGPVLTIADLIAFIDSVGDLSNDRFGNMLNANLANQILLGLNGQISCGGCAGGGALIGSAQATAHGRAQFTPELTLFGGGRLGRTDHRGIRSPIEGGIALSLQYDPVDLGPSRPYLSGFVAGSYAKTDFDRRYVSPSFGTFTGRGDSHDWGLSAGATAGYVSRVSPRTELAVSVGYARQWQFVGSYDERVGADNPFAAAVGGGSDRLNTVSSAVQWTQLVARAVEFTVSGSANYAFDAKAGARADIAGLAIVPDRPDFGYYQAGARIGARLSRRATLDLFVNRIFTPGAIGSSTHGGGSLRITL